MFISHRPTRAFYIELNDLMNVLVLFLPLTGFGEAFYNSDMTGNANGEMEKLYFATIR